MSEYPKRVGSIRKYVINPRVIAAGTGLLPVLWATGRSIRGKRGDARLGVLWLFWLGGLVLALRTVKERSDLRRGPNSEPPDPS